MKTPKKPVHASIFLPDFNDGGVERMMVNIARGLADKGLNVDFITQSAGRPYLEFIPESVRLIFLKTNNIKQELTSYLHMVQPEVLLSSKPENDLIAINCVRSSGSSTRVYPRLGAPQSPHYKMRRRYILKNWLRSRDIQKAYHQADGIICVSHGVAADVQRTSKLPASMMHAIPNPTVTPEIATLARENLDHPWFAANQPPVILGVGRLSRVKNFPLLLRAFADVRQERPCRLMILGSGKKRNQLLRLASRLGIDADFALPGFVSNPYMYMAKAALFVLSSNIEGSPNVLVEAMACGTPVVATDCPSGPREILEDGRHGYLIPMEDKQAMVAAINATLDAPPAPDTLQAAVERYTLHSSTLRYMEVMQLTAP